MKLKQISTTLTVAASSVAALFLSSCLNKDAPIVLQAASATTVATEPAGPAIPAAVVGQTYTTASGLQYRPMRIGKGKRPRSFDKVKVHYHGTLPDGTVFDSSVQRGEPSSFPLNGVISGWTEGLQLMQEGSKYYFTIPHYLAYGLEGFPPKIGPKQTLNFEVELIEVL
ncbi:FKBP-type peptidyl-prolyl cis-trans isomerase [Verrucomicrobiales bacterium]|nr:FKBP-type peptidyl-prolyl cis-trans isomerase [Verrucomicrobiales bacterium]